MRLQPLQTTTGIDPQTYQVKSKLSHLIRILILVLFLIPAISYSQLPDQFQKVELVTGLTNAVKMEFAPDGRIFIIDRYGEVFIYKPAIQTMVSAGTIDVFSDLEDGLLDLAFDPDFENNSYVYIHYSPLAVSKNRVSRFQMNGDQLVTTSETIILEWNTQRIGGFHAAGDLDFDSQGNLYIATGDNSNHSPYATLDEVNLVNSAEKSASNTNDLRGKILRIRPLPDGSYAIPNDNLFPDGVGGLPEIYVMGARNPFRIFVDKENTDWLFWAEVGPDANQPSALGPVGYDEINLTKQAGNYGWPYITGDNVPYLNTYSDPQFYYDPLAPVNISVWNTGAVNLPPAQPSWLHFFHECYLAGDRYYYDPALTDAQRLPVEFDNMFFYFDFNTSQVWVVEMDQDGNILNNEQWAPAVFPNSNKGFIDMKIGPDGHMYILEYGAGCCPNNVGTGKLVRVDYTGIVSNQSPVVKISADPNSGSLPLTVQFSSAGTFDPDGDPLIYEWDFETDGIIDSNEENPQFTYNSAGNYNAQLRVSDDQGGMSTKNITIYAGNNSAQITFNNPPDGGLFNWGDDIAYDIQIDDVEDGSTTNGTISCNDVNLVPSLGHLNHFHDGLTINNCSGTLTVQTDHDIEGQDDIFYVLGVNYTDGGGLTSFNQIVVHPKRAEAEFYDESSGITEQANTDLWGGGSKSIRVDHDGYISFSGRNLLNINGIKYRYASNSSGGIIEVRLDSPTGQLISTTTIPSTGGWDNWDEVSANITAPTGKHDIFFVFLSNPGETGLFDLNWIEFMGSGVSVDNTPPTVNNVEVMSKNALLVEFSEYVDPSTALNTANYSINNGINVNHAMLQEDGRTVMLHISDLSLDVNDLLTISGVTNQAGLPMATDVLTFKLGNIPRFNAGGAAYTTSSGFTYNADDYGVGGKTYSTGVVIAGTDDDPIYQTERWGAFSYEIPVEQTGLYDIKLHFAEIYFGVDGPAGSGLRVFNVNLEENPILTNFDIYDEVGAATALVKTFQDVEITDGAVSLDFIKVVDNPKLSAIEVIFRQAIVPEPSIVITTPTDGSDVNEPFSVSFTIENYEIGEGIGHMHKFVDGGHIGNHYSLDPITFDDLGVGTHLIRLELYTAGHEPTGYFDEITVNVVNEIACNTAPFPLQWGKKSLEELPTRAYHTFPEHDLDGDGFKDIVTGKWWYKNPGSIDGQWVRTEIGTVNQIVHVFDFDGDGDKDLIGTRATLEFIWEENDGAGNFTEHTNIEQGTSTNTDFLSEMTGGYFQAGGPYQMALTWNKGEQGTSGVQMITVPADPINDIWPVETIHPTSLGEGLSAGDIDGDGDLDLHQAGNWLRNDDGTWTLFSTGLTLNSDFDRNILVDIDRDGDLDAFVGQLGFPEEFVWIENPADPTQLWTKHVIDPSLDGVLSVGVHDFDGDGDPDVIVGEWQGAHQVIAYENDLCNSGTWIKHILDNSGTPDHHNGGRLADMDNDGDLDMVSNGWNDFIPTIYENGSSVQAESLVRINGGGPALNTGGNDWIADDYFTGGRLWSNVTDVANTTDDVLYHTERYTSTGSMVYNIPVPFPGDYNVDLHFAEMYFGLLGAGGSGSRVFNVDIEGSAQLNNYDIFAAAGGAGTAVIENFTAIPVTDGFLTITFTSVVNNAKISAIEVFNAVTDQPPVVNAGEDQTVNLPDSDIILNGTANDPDGGAIASYLWDQVSGPALATLTDETTASLIASDLVEGTYVFQLTATDNEGDMGTDQVSVIVNPAGQTEIPVVDAGVDQTIFQPTTTTTLNGTANDPDGGTIESYLWTQVSGPSTATLTNADTPDVQVSGLAVGDYTFQLEVTDDEAETNTDEVMVSVQTAPAWSEHINAGGLAIAFNGIDWIADAYNVGGRKYQNVTAIANTENDAIYQTERYTSTGAMSYQIPVPDPGNYLIRLHFAELWFGVNAAGGVGSRIFDVDIEGQAQLTNYDIVAAAGGPATAVVEEFQVTVNDGFASVAFTSVVENAKVSAIEILSADNITYPPQVDAGADQLITLPVNAVVLTGTAVDPDGGTPTPQWSQISGPSTATLTDAATLSLTAADLVEGVYIFELLATDDENETGSDQVTVTVNPEGASFPPIVDAGEDVNIELPVSQVTLTGTGSDPDGGPVTFLWEQVTGPGTATLANENTAELTASNLVAGSYEFSLTVTDDETDTSVDQVIVNVTTAPAWSMRITSGGTTFDFNGDQWSTDQNFAGGKKYTTGAAIANTENDLLYQTERYATAGTGGQIVYNIPVPAAGNYDVNLHFAEIFFGVQGAGGVGSRVFDVDVEGQQQLTDYDIVVAAGGSATAVIESFTGITVNDGSLTVTLTSVIENAKISGVEVVENTSMGTAIDLSDDLPVTANETRIYPNPFRNTFTILFDPNQTYNTILIYDLRGQLILEEHNIAGSSFSVDLSNQPAGLYQVIMKSSEDEIMLRVMKE